MDESRIGKVIEAADLLKGALQKAVANEQGLHAETLVASSARMAGTMLFLSFDLPDSGLEPGDPVMNAAADKDGPALLQTMFSTLKKLGQNDLDDRNLGGRRDTTELSHLGLAETQQRLMPWYEKVRELLGLNYRETAMAGAIATAALINDCSSVLDVHAGCAIALHGVVESVKTVPTLPAV